MANITETANLCGLKRENFQTTKSYLQGTVHTEWQRLSVGTQRRS